MKATNQHGVHSPFIYSYVTQCLYTKRNRKLSKTADALVKSIKFFNCRTIAVLPDNCPMTALLHDQLPHLNSLGSTFDMIFIDLNRTKMPECIVDHVHNNSMIFCKGIYDTHPNRTTWKSIKKNDAVRVTVDLFYCGVVFFRTQQAKEHFKIRL